MCSDGGSGAHSVAADRLYNIQGDIAQEGWNLYKKNYEPLERSAIQDVKQLENPNYVGQIVDRNVQDVAEQFSKVKGEQERRAWGLGINPQDGMSGGSRALDLAQAGSTAAAANMTRLNLKNTALQAKLGLLNTGRGLANNAGAQVGAAAGGFASMANAERQAAGQEAAGTGAAIGGIATAIAIGV